MVVCIRFRKLLSSMVRSNVNSVLQEYFSRQVLDKNPEPTKEEVKKAIVGNLCRCTGYVKVIEAILAVARK